MKCKCFKSWCLENFPFIEDDFDALTNYDLLCKLKAYITKIGNDVANLNDEYNHVVESVDKIYNYVQEYLTDVDELKEGLYDVNERIDLLISDYNNRFNTINNRFDTMEAVINDFYNDLNNKITNIETGDISVYDPTTGLLSPLQTVINNLSSLANVDGLTATEFDTLDLTATAFDAYEITARDFDASGKTILV